MAKRSPWQEKAFEKPRRRAELGCRRLAEIRARSTEAKRLASRPKKHPHAAMHRGPPFARCHDRDDDHRAVRCQRLQIANFGSCNGSIELHPRDTFSHSRMEILGKVKFLQEKTVQLLQLPTGSETWDWA